jgi:hypothetical protein
MIAIGRIIAGGPAALKMATGSFLASEGKVAAGRVGGSPRACDQGSRVVPKVLTSPLFIVSRHPDDNSNRRTKVPFHANEAFHLSSDKHAAQTVTFRGQWILSNREKVRDH